MTQATAMSEAKMAMITGSVVIGTTPPELGYLHCCWGWVWSWGWGWGRYKKYWGYGRQIFC